MMIAELRYLGNYLAVFCAVVAVFVVSVAIGSVAHLNPMAATAVFLVVGSATLLGWAVFFVRRHARASTGAVSATPKQARYLPLLLDVVLLGWFTYRLAATCMAVHAGEHISGDSAILSGWWFILCLVYAIRDVRDKFRSPESPASPGFSAAKLAALTAAYQLPTRAQRRRALAPLRNRGYGRLALFLGMLVLFFVIEPYYGVGVAMLASFGIVVSTFLILHKLVDL